MSFIAGFALGVLTIIGISLLSVDDNSDDDYDLDNHTDFR
jgi:hypothetical protein